MVTHFNVQKAQTASIYKRSNARIILLSGHSETGGNKQFRIFFFSTDGKRWDKTLEIQYDKCKIDRMRAIKCVYKV